MHFILMKQIHYTILSPTISWLVGLMILQNFYLKLGLFNYNKVEKNSYALLLTYNTRNKCTIL